MKKTFGALISVLFLSSCLTANVFAPKASKDQDLQAKHFERSEGAANIYVYRTGGFASAFSPIKLQSPSLDQICPCLATSTFVEFKDVPPGHYVLTALRSSGTTFAGKPAFVDASKDLLLSVETGKNYYFSVQVNHSFIIGAAWIVTEKTEEEARTDITDFQLIAADQIHTVDPYTFKEIE